MAILPVRKPQQLPFFKLLIIFFFIKLLQQLLSLFGPRLIFGLSYPGHFLASL